MLKDILFKFLKIFVIIVVIIVMVFIVFPTVKYRYSPFWLTKEKIVILEKEFYTGNCDSAMNLFRHYKKSFYKDDLAKKWLFYAEECYTTQKSHVMKDNISINNINISVVVDKVKYKKDKNSSFAYGKLTIKTNNFTERSLSMNLNCIKIMLDGIGSDKIYIDSIASVLTDNYQFVDNKIDVKVYWVFNKVNVTNNTDININIDMSNFNEHTCMKSNK